MSLPTLFHVGYHKTATTWMQRRFFTEEHGFCPVATHEEVFRHIVQPHGLLFDAGEMRELLDRRRAEAGEGLVPVVSSEILSGQPFEGGQQSDVYAERIKQIAPGARILISIRDQLGLLPSIYMQYLLRGGTAPPEVFFAGTNEPGYFGFSAHHFEYDRLVAHYQKLFGAEKVLVVTQEHLRADMEGFSRKVAEFAGATRYEGLAAGARSVQSPSYPQHAVPVLRRVNHLQQSTLNPTPVVRLGRTPFGLYKLFGYALKKPPLSSWLGRRKPVAEHVRRSFRGRFTESNRRLAALTGGSADLSGYD